MARTAGQIEARGEGCWRVRVFKGRDENGKRQYVSVNVKGSRRDAERKLRKMLEEHDRGRLTVPSKLALGAFLDEWLAVAVKPRVRAATYGSYLVLVKTYVKPGLGMVRLDRLTAMDIQRWLNALAEQPLRRQPRKSGERQGKNGEATPTALSARTRRAAFAVLRAALRQAVRWRVLPSNPSDEVDAPGKRPARSMKVLTAEQASTFLAGCKGERLEAFFVLALATGCRPGELAALRWADVDLKRERLNVTRAMARLAGGAVEYGEPKTDTGRRMIPLPPSAVVVLREHRQRQLEERMKHGGEWEDSDLVFTGEDGAPLQLGNVRRRDFHRIVKRADLPEGLTLYSLRHTAASILIDSGVHVKAVSERLGHTSPGFTMKTYVQSMPTMQEQAAATLEKVIFTRHHD